jgi:tellurite resistance protein
MTLSAQDALIYLMVVAASSDAAMSEKELTRIDTLVGRLPVFAGYDRTRIGAVANACIDQLNGEVGFEGVLDLAVAALPERLEDTAYAVCVEVTAVDLSLEQEELRMLEMLRDRLSLTRLTTAAIEAAARALHRRA